jgi:hypothetical protein
MEQNERLKNIAILGQYVQSVESDPTKTDEYKALVRQKYFSALGMETLKSFDGQKGGKGKKGKGGAGDQQQQGPEGMVAGILKHVATGLVGGEMPKGAPDVNPHELIGQMEAEYHGNQNKYSVQGIIDQSLGGIQGALKALPQDATQEDALTAIGPHLQAIQRVDPARAESIRKDFLGRYQPAPPVGSTAAYLRDYMRSQQTQPPQRGAPAPAPNATPGQPPEVPQPSAPGQGVPPPQPPTGSAPPQPSPPSNAQPGVGSQAGEPSTQAGPPAPAGPGAQKTFDRTEWFLANAAGLAQKQEQFEYGPANHPTRFNGQFVNTPEGVSGYYYPNGQPVPVDPSEVRKASTTEPREPRAPRWTTEHPVQDPNSKTGWSLYSRNEDTGEEHLRTGAPKPASERPVRGPVVSATSKLAERKINVAEAISKILSQTLQPTPLKDAKGKETPITGTAWAKWYMDHVKDFYGKDKAVAPYLAEIQAWFTDQGRRETYKDPNALWQGVVAAGEKAQGELQQSQTNDKLDSMQQKFNDLDTEILGAPTSTGGTSYDEIER